MRFPAALICLLSILSSVPALASESPVAVKSELLQRLIDFSSDLTGWNDRQNIACRDYRLGETRRLQSPHGSYFLTKTNQNSYLAQVNVQFAPAAGVRAGDVARFREKVKGCFHRADSLRDTSGKRLRLELVEPGTVQFSRSKPVTILVHPTDRREDSLNYFIGTDCPTILHEALHLLGLKDEYEEKDKDMSCRSLGDSIMSTQTSVYVSGLLWQEEALLYNDRNKIFRLVDGITCNDSLGGTRHEFSYHSERKQYHLWKYSGAGFTKTKLLAERIDLFVPTKDAGAKGKLALSENTKKLMQLDPSLKWDCTFALERAASARLQTGAQILAAREKLPPLRPAHFRKILYPKCREKNQVYDFCSWETYLVRQPGYQCLKQQYEACSNGAWLN